MQNMTNEEKFKENLRKQISFLRSLSEEEVLKMDSKLLDKKKEFDQIPEEKIEEYIHQSYIIFSCYEQIGKKLKSEEKDKKELTENAILKVEEVDISNKEIISNLRMKLKEFSNRVLIQLSPLGLGYYFQDLNDTFADVADARDNSPLMQGAILSTIALVSLIIFVGYPLQEDLSIAQLMQQDSHYQNAAYLIVGSALLFALYDIGLFSKILVDALSEHVINQKEFKDSVKVLKELGIYDIVVEKNNAQERINQILSKGLVM